MITKTDYIRMIEFIRKIEKIIKEETLIALPDFFAKNKEDLRLAINLGISTLEFNIDEELYTINLKSYLSDEFESINKNMDELIEFLQQDKKKYEHKILRKQNKN